VWRHASQCDGKKKKERNTLKAQGGIDAWSRSSSRCANLCDDMLASVMEKRKKKETLWKHRAGSTHDHDQAAGAQTCVTTCECDGEKVRNTLKAQGGIDAWSRSSSWWANLCDMRVWWEKEHYESIENRSPSRLRKKGYIGGLEWARETYVATGLTLSKLYNYTTTELKTKIIQLYHNWTQD